jgi:thiosulfate/3-mercaptopyruvate sulfurtransferase
VIPPVVDRSWLEQPNVVFADVRWYLDGRSGRAAYETGHIPGAVFVDLDRDLAGPANARAGRHPLPSPDAFARSMSRSGIGDDTTVVAYDDASGAQAARLVWMLRVTGHQAAVLDGGLAAYDGPLSRESVSPVPAPFTPRAWPQERLADVDDASDATNVVIDARSRARYRGDEEPVDARAGHIPGALNLPYVGNLAPDQRFLPPEQLRQRFASIGVTEASAVISYCGSGVTACHNLLALEHAGLGPGRLYPGSWSQYSHLTDRPLETGDLPTQPDRTPTTE